MASRKEYELLFKLKASVGAGFNSTFKNAIETNKELQNTMQKLNSVAGKINGFQSQTSVLTLQRDKLSTLNKEYEKLKTEIENTEKPTKELTKSLEKKKAQIDKTIISISKQEERLAKLESELKKAGVDTDNLGASNKKLTESYEKLKKSQETLGRLSQLQDENNAKIMQTRNSLLKTTGVLTAIGTAIYMGPVATAKEFETSMSDVIKVVDGLRDSTGKLTPEYYAMHKGLLDLSRRIPLTASGLTEIAAAAGQAGIARNEILQFSEDAAKMGIAFDTSAQEAGDAMAKWRTSFKLTQSEVVELADKINYLSNNTASTANEISAIVTKIGPLGDVAGFTSGEIAALGATLVGVGVNQDVAATGIKKLMTSMTAGSSATARQKAVLDQLGLSATELADRMQVDAQGAVLDFMAALNKLPKAEQAAALKNYFGEESVAAIAPLLTSLGTLEENFNMVGDASKYAGSMEKEFAAKSATTANRLELAKNKLNAFLIVLGNTFLPMVGDAADTAGSFIDKLTEFTTANPELVTGLFKAGAGLGALKLATDGAMLGFYEIKDGVLEAKKFLEIFKANVNTTAIESASGTSKILELGQSAQEYFNNIKNSFGNVGGAFEQFEKIKELKGQFQDLQISKQFSKLKEKLGGDFNGVGNKLLAPFKTLNENVGQILSPFGDKVTSIFGNIANGPIGKLGGVFKSLGGTVGAVFQPLGGLIGNLGGLFGGLFTKAMPVILIISALSALLLKLNGGDLSSFIEPIKQAFQEARPIIESVGKQFMELGSRMMPLLINAAQQLAPLFSQLVVSILPVLVMLIEQLSPILIQMIEQILPVVLQVITQLAPLLTNIITTVLPVLMVILQALMPVIQILANLITGALQGAFTAVLPIIDSLKMALGGIIEFVTGVFTGNWKMAWEGVKNIFGGIFGSLVGLVKLPFNTIISGINSVFASLNKMEIPDWVPIVGGQKMNFPQIPQFAKGTNSTPDTFIAGEKGAELITGASGKKVFTARQTSEIFENLKGIISTVSKLNIPSIIPQSPNLQYSFAGAPGLNMTKQAPRLDKDGFTQKIMSISISNQPIIQISGDKPDDLDAKLKKNNDELLKEFDDRLREKEDKERRGRYE